MPKYLTLEEVEKRHHEIIWPTVRIRAKDAWGSGTVIYSKSDKSGKFHTYILTCHHVIASNIKVEKVWDQRVGIEVKKEIRTPVEVQFFYYENLSYAKGLSGSHRAEIVCYDERQDIALLELEMQAREIEWVATLYPEDKIRDVHVYDAVFACGAAMAHEPIATDGIITFMNEIIDDYDYWMTTAQIIFGNSGGAVFRYSVERDKFEFIGIPARVEVNISGFSAQAITHMGFFVPITRIYNLFRENQYEFLFNPEVTYEDCEKQRKLKAEEDKKLFMSKYGGSPIEEKRK